MWGWWWRTLARSLVVAGVSGRRKECVTRRGVTAAAAAPSEVALPAALHADLAEGQHREEAHVPGDHQQPELVADGGGLHAYARMNAGMQVVVVGAQQQWQQWWWQADGAGQGRSHIQSITQGNIV